MPDTTYINQTNTTQLPAWMQSAINDLLARGTSLANEQFQPYTGQRLAPLNADQNASFQGVRDLQGQYAPWLGIGSAFASQAGSNSSLDAGQGMLGIGGAYAGRAGEGNQYMTNAADMFSGVAGANTAGLADPLIGEGSGFLRQSAAGSGAATANPFIQQSVDPTGLALANPLIQQSTLPGGLAAAAPYLGMAGTSFPGMADAYMNPYIRNVTDEIARLGGRNLSENLLPQISDQFVRAGQFGSAQQRDVVGRALRDTQDSILAQQGQALQQGYGQAAQIYGQDAGRYAGLAGTAGGLGSAQQQALLQAGTSLGGLGQNQQQILQSAGNTIGGLTNADLARLQSAGVNLGQFGIAQANLAAQDKQRSLAAAQGLAGLGQMQMQGQLGAANAFTGIGNAQINASQGDARNALGAAGTLGGLAGQGNTIGLQNAGALGSVGDQQQNQVQNNLNIGYGDYQQQQQYPWQNLSNLSSLVHGLPMSQSSTLQGSTTSPSPSVISQVGGLGLGAVGLANSGIFRAQGGAVKYPRYKKKTHSYGNVPRRGATFSEAA